MTAATNGSRRPAREGQGFLADVVRAWEAELRPLAEQRPHVRVPVVRTGIVLARHGGALAEMLPMFRLSAAGRLGSGRQWMSWIHLDDIVGLFLHALDARRSGVLEGVAPQPVTNRRFTTALCRSLGVIENLPAPSFAIHALFGERAAIVLGSTRLEPLATQASGFRFRFETVEQALDDLLAPLRGGVRQRVWEQWLPHAAQDDLAVLLRCEQPRGHHAALPLLPRARAVDAGDRRRHADRLPAQAERHPDRMADPHRHLGSAAPLRRPAGEGAVLAVAPHARLHPDGRRHADARHRSLPPAGGLGRRSGRWLQGEVDVERIFDYRSRKIDERFGA